MAEILNKLKEGVRYFRRNVYQEHAAQYQYAATNPQKPHTLIIGCADSRVSLENITHSGPGDIFIMRNIGNMVPAYGEMLGGVSAVIEYAVSALGVEHIVICGHSDCGAMKALLQPEAAASMPTVKSWLSNGSAALAVAQNTEREDGRELLPVLTEQNVLMQLLHLKTHPSVATAISQGKLTVSGWVYDIGSGEVRIAEDGGRTFEPVSLEEAEAGLEA